jgi:FolB domain-containing protein
VKELEDKIYIKNLVLPCKIGILEEERSKVQDVVVDVEIFHELREAGSTDDINKTVDYSLIRQKIFDAVSKGESRLLETVAQKITSLLLEDPETLKVTVRVSKKKYNQDPMIGIEITRIQHG